MARRTRRDDPPMDDAEAWDYFKYILSQLSDVSEEESFQQFLNKSESRSKSKSRLKGGRRTKTRKRSRQDKNCCTTMVPLDTAKIRQEHLNKYKQRKQVLEELEAQIRRCEEYEIPEYEKFVFRTCGSKITKLRELREQIALVNRRLHIIWVLADYYHMECGRYCMLLQEWLEPEQEFWSLLDEEWVAYVDIINHEKDIFSRKRTEDEVDGIDHRSFDSGDHWEVDEENFNHQDGETISDHGRGKRLTPKEEKRLAELKKLYRQLCYRYHPDRIGVHDDKMRRLWNDIQDAYQEGDLYKLQAIYTGTESESAQANLSCSEIMDLIKSLEVTIRETRKEVNTLKHKLFWGFGTWTDAKVQRMKKYLVSDYGLDISKTQGILSDMRKELYTYLHWKPPKPKKTKSTRSKKLAKSMFPLVELMREELNEFLDF